LNSTGKVYFQPPENIQLVYPAIIYQLDNISMDHADNVGYRRTKRYQVTVIDQDPDSEISDKVAQLPLISFSRFFIVDQLNHFVYDLYF
jgi:hypothetical protein